MRNLRRAVILVSLILGVALAGLPGGATADTPFWSSPIALGPHDTSTIAAREGLLLASGVANHYDAHPLEGGGIRTIPGPRVAGLFRSTDQGRRWTLARQPGPEGELVPITTPPDLLAVAPAGDAYALFGSQMWRSSDNGVVWSQVGNVGGQATTLDVLGDGRVVAGMVSGGLRVSSDRGATWAPMGSGLPSQRINELEVLGTGTMLIATDGGLYRSTDSAGTFTQVTSGIIDPAAVAYGVANEGSSAILLATEGETAGTAIYTSTNDGASFQPRPNLQGSGATAPRAFRGTVEASVQASLYVFYIGTTGGLFRSGNTGLSTYTWERVDPEPGYREVREVTLGEDTDPHPSIRHHIVYAAVRRASPVAVTSTESRMLAPGWYDQLEGGRICGGMVSRPDGSLFAACGRHIFRSDDRGANWSAVTKGLPYLHPIGDTPYFPLSAGPDGSLWVSGYDRGLYHSNAAVTSWSKVPIPAASVGLVTPAPADGQIVLASGLTLNGSREVLWRTTDGGTTWNPVTAVGRSITSIDISPAAPNRVLVTTNSNGGWVSEDAGATWTKATGLPQGSLYDASFSDANPSVAWAIALSGESWVLHRSGDAGRTWVETGPVKIGNQSKAAFQIAPSPWSTDTVYIPSIDGDLVVTRDRGDTFSKVDGGLPKDPCSICETVDNVTFDARERGVLYVTAGILDPNNGPQSNWVYRAVDPTA